MESLIRCIQVDRDYVDICVATAQLLSRDSEFSRPITASAPTFAMPMPGSAKGTPTWSIAGGVRRPAGGVHRSADGSRAKLHTKDRGTISPRPSLGQLIVESLEGFHCPH